MLTSRGAQAAPQEACQREQAKPQCACRGLSVVIVGRGAHRQKPKMAESLYGGANFGKKLLRSSA